MKHPLVEWRSAVLSAGGPPGATARAVAVALAEFADFETLEAFPSVDRLAERSGASERAVRDKLGILERDGWVVKLAQGGRRSGPRTTHWRLMTPAPDAEIPTTTPAPPADVTPAGGAEVADPTPAAHAVTSAAHATTSAAPAPEQVLPRPERGGVDARKLVTGGTRDELSKHLKPLEQKYGQSIVGEGLDYLHSKGEKYQYPRYLADALGPICGTIRSQREEQRTRERTATDGDAIVGDAGAQRARECRAALRKQPAEVAS